MSFHSGACKQGSVPVEVGLPVVCSMENCSSPVCSEIRYRPILAVLKSLKGGCGEGHDEYQSQHQGQVTFVWAPSHIRIYDTTRQHIDCHRNRESVHYEGHRFR